MDYGIGSFLYSHDHGFVLNLVLMSSLLSFEEILCLHVERFHCELELICTFAWYSHLRLSSACGSLAASAEVERAIQF